MDGVAGTAMFPILSLDVCGGDVYYMNPFSATVHTLSGSNTWAMSRDVVAVLKWFQHHNRNPQDNPLMEGAKHGSQPPSARPTSRTLGTLN